MLRHMQCSAHLSNELPAAERLRRQNQTSVVTCNMQGALYVLIKGEERSLRIKLCRVRRSVRAYLRRAYLLVPAEMRVSVNLSKGRGECDER